MRRGPPAWRAFARRQWVPGALGTHRATSSATVAAFAAVLALSALAAPPAFAHARLLRTSPAEGARLQAAPATVAFEFDERVRSSSPADVSGGTLRGTLKRPARLKDGGREVIVSLPSGLGRGVYSVTWHVVSDDGHQELGTLVFGVGRRRPGRAPARPSARRATAGWTWRAGCCCSGRSPPAACPACASRSRRCARTAT